jgi:hypothetical protein
VNVFIKSGCGGLSGIEIVDIESSPAWYYIDFIDWT